MLLELLLELLLQLVSSACASCSKRWPSTRLALDVLLELAARLIAHHAAAGLQLLLIALQRLRLLGALRLLLLRQRLHLGRGRLAVGRQLRDRLQVHERELRTLRERRGRLRCRRRCRRGCAGAAGAGGLPAPAPAARARGRGRSRARGLSRPPEPRRATRSHERQRRGNSETFHYGKSFRENRITAILSERRPHGEAELERLLRLQLVVEHPDPLTGCRRRSAGTGTFSTGMKKRISAPVDVLKSLSLPVTVSARRSDRSDRSCSGSTSSGRRRTIADVSFQANGCRVAHLAGVVEQDQPHRPGDVDDLLEVEQQALVAAEHQAGDSEVRSGPIDAEVEAADAVLAAEEQLLEDRQVERCAEGAGRTRPGRGSRATSARSAGRTTRLRPSACRSWCCRRARRDRSTA